LSYHQLTAEVFYKQDGDHIHNLLFHLNTFKNESIRQTRANPTCLLTPADF
jgi:hypothetical protein